MHQQITTVSTFVPATTAEDRQYQGRKTVQRTATGAIPGRLAGLPVALVHRGRADSTMRWLLKPTPRALLQTIGAEESITYASVDACLPGQARHHLRALLVDAGVLPARDEQTERLDTWVNEYLTQFPPHHAAVITPYAQ